MMIHSPGMLNGVKWTSLSAIVNAIVKLGQVSILTRFLTKDEFGLMAIALWFISFSDIFVDMGFASAVLHRQDISKKEYSSLYWFNILSGCVLSILIFICTPHIAHYYKNEQLVGIISLLSLIPFLASISRLQRTFQQKKMQFRFMALVEMISSILMVIFSIILIYLNFVIYSLVLSLLFYHLLIAIIYIIRSIFKEKNILFHFHLAEIMPFLKIGIYRVGSSILNYFSSEMDIILISSIYPLETLGFYSLCKQLTQRILGFLNPILTKVLTPTLAHLQSSRESLINKYVQILTLLSNTNFPLFFLIAYTSIYVLAILYGDTYAGYGLIFSLFIINGVLISISNPIGSLLTALGKTNMEFYLNIFRVITTFIILKISSLFNIYILVLSVLVVTIFFIYLEVIFVYKKVINIGFKKFVRIIKNPLLICMLLSPLFLFQYIIQNKYIGFFVAAILFISIYIFIYLLIDKKSFMEVACYLKLDKLYFYKFIKKLNTRKNVN